MGVFTNWFWMDGRNLVEIYFKKKIPKKPADFIIAVTGNRIEEELRGVGTCSLLRV